MLQIYTPHLGERLIYVLNYVLIERLGLEYKIGDKPESENNAVTIAYGGDVLPSSLYIKPSGLLESAGIRPLDDINPYLYPLKDFDLNIHNGQFPDIFSAVFFHLSRYEEYGSAKDIHGRYDYRNSCLYRHHLLDIPIVDVWINRFADFLNLHYGIKTQNANAGFSTRAELDIDSIYAYKGRNIFRQFAAIGKDILTGSFNELSKRLKVLAGFQKDPNDNFGLQEQLLLSSKAIYFVQVGPYGTYDKNINPQSQAFTDILNDRIKKGHEIGLHPSYQSNSDRSLILKEKEILEKMCGHEIKRSRQHFLRFSLPLTYRALSECRIEHEHSMGYSETTGFRAGSGFSFPWYDLEAEKTTTLRIHPFSVMDVALKQFAKMNVSEALIAIEKIKSVCKQEHIPFVFVFHNESLSGHRGWENWDSVFKNCVNG